MSSTPNLGRVSDCPVQCSLAHWVRSLLPSFISSGISNMPQTAVRVLHYFEIVSKHFISLIRIRAVIMFYCHSNNSMTHFTFSCVNPRISIYKTGTNMDWNIVCFSPPSKRSLSRHSTRDNSYFSPLKVVFVLRFFILRIARRNSRSRQLWHSRTFV